MQFTTPVSLPARPMTLQPSDRLMMLGSCFAQHVGEELSHALPPTDIDVNPFGVLYNPLSIAGAVGSLLSVAPPVGHIFHGGDGVFHSWLHTSRFSARTEAECRERITLRHAAASQRVSSASHSGPHAATVSAQALLWPIVIRSPNRPLRSMSPLSMR